MRIHQIVQGFAPRDGTSNLALKIRGLLRETGIEDPRIFCRPEGIAAECRADCRDIAELDEGPEDVLLYHFGNASPLTQRFLASGGRKVLVYHNFTPPEFFRVVAPERARALESARDELAGLAGRTDMAWAISHYNMRALEELGFTNLRHFPEWMNTAALSLAPARLVLPENELRLLFVGRLAPNKNIEELLRVFYYFKHTGPDGFGKRLVIAGSGAGMELYTSLLNAMVRDFDLTQDVTFTGPVSQAELNAWYRSAHAFVCASRHEGFCIPLLEAAHFGLPVFARDIPALRETLDGSGVLIKDKDPRAAALLISEVLENDDLRGRITAGQRKRLADFSRERVKARLGELVAEISGTK